MKCETRMDDAEMEPTSERLGRIVGSLPRGARDGGPSATPVAEGPTWGEVARLCAMGVPALLLSLLLLALVGMQFNSGRGLLILPYALLWAGAFACVGGGALTAAWAEARELGRRGRYVPHPGDGCDHGWMVVRSHAGAATPRCLHCGAERSEGQSPPTPR